MRAARVSATTDGPTSQSPHPAHSRKDTKHESGVHSARERACDRVSRGCACGGRFNAADPSTPWRTSRKYCCESLVLLRDAPCGTRPTLSRHTPAYPCPVHRVLGVDHGEEVGRLVDSIINDGGGVGEKFAVDDGTIEPCVRSGLERSAGLAVGAQCQGDERRAQKRRQGWWAGRGEEKAGRMFEAASHLSVPPPEGSAMVALVPVQ